MMNEMKLLLVLMDNLAPGMCRTSGICDILQQYARRFVHQIPHPYYIGNARLEGSLCPPYGYTYERLWY